MLDEFYNLVQLYSLKLIIAFLGSICSCWVRNEFLLTEGRVSIPFFWRGFRFAIASTVGGIILLNPGDLRSAFVAGLVGWYVIVNLINQYNVGLSNPDYQNRALPLEEIAKKQKETD